MPVTINIADVPSENVKQWLIATDLTDIDDFLYLAYPKAIRDGYNVCQSSYNLSGSHGKTGPSANGLFHSMLLAYNHHHHVRIRPDEIWVAIMVQFTNYVRAHHDEMRSHFVEHDGKKSLILLYPATDKDHVDYSEFARQMSDMLRQNLVDESLYDWIMPCFSTTTENDLAVASAVMMATLQDYFMHSLVTWCGIPSVTLLGERQDYLVLLKKLEFFSRFGDEVSRFSLLLKKVLKEMIRSFDEPLAVSDFWASSILEHTERSGQQVFTGWMTAFCFWDKDGKCLYDTPWTGKEQKSLLVMDGLVFQPIRSEDVPTSWCSLPVIVIDNGKVINMQLFAGSMGITCTSSNNTLNEDGQEFLDTVMPAQGWIMCEPIAGDIS